MLLENLGKGREITEKYVLFRNISIAIFLAVSLVSYYSIFVPGLFGKIFPFILFSLFAATLFSLLNFYYASVLTRKNMETSRKIFAKGGTKWLVILVLAFMFAIPFILSIFY